MPNFSGPEGELSEIYLNDTSILDRYVGNQLWLWGTSVAGQLGDNTVASKSSPVQTVSGGTNWVQISLANGDTGPHSGAIKTDGTLWLWGSNDKGQLGDNSVTNKSSPVQTVSGGTNWYQVSCSGNHTAAIKTDGTLWLWGENIDGRLGDNTTTSKSSPVQTVAGGTNWKQVSAGYAATAAIKTDGTLWTWGSSATGQLGDDTITNKTSPVQTVAGGTNWKQVSAAGRGHMAAIKTDGTLWTWGENSDGRLGDNTVVNKSSPVQTVAGGTNWKQVSCGHRFTAAIKTDGTLWLWGLGTAGELGDNTRVSKSSPVQTVAGGTNWKQVSAGRIHTSALKIDNTLWTWGWNASGQLGDNTVASKSSPVQTVAGGTNWKQVSAGNSITAAVTYTES